jgi:hypothetical protein
MAGAPGGFGLVDRTAAERAFITFIRTSQDSVHRIIVPSQTLTCSHNGRVVRWGQSPTEVPIPSREGATPVDEFEFHIR